MKPAILVPYDFSSPAGHALRWAADLRRSVDGGSITLLHVGPLPSGPLLYGIPLPPPSANELGALSAELRDAADRMAPGASVEVTVAPNVAQKLLEAAAAWHIDLIVMGTHGRGGVKRLLLGSIADHVVRHARCPVVTVRGPSE